MTPQRLVLTFKPDSLEVRALYHTKAVSNPGTNARRREVTQLVSSGLREALEAFEGGAGRVDVIGTPGFETREDTSSLDGRAA